jgi:hypothetical protein
MSATDTLPASQEILSTETLALVGDMTAQLGVGETMTTATVTLVQLDTGAAFPGGLSGVAALIWAGEADHPGHHRAAGRQKLPPDLDWHCRRQQDRQRQDPVDVSGMSSRLVGDLGVPLASNALLMIGVGFALVAIPADLAQLGPVLVGIVINIVWGTVQRHWIEADRRVEAANVEASRGRGGEGRRAARCARDRHPQSARC